MSAATIEVPISCGKWSWNDDYADLEFIGDSPVEEERRQRERQQRAVIKDKNKIAGGYNRNKPLRRLPRKEIKPSKTHTKVTLQDVKEVAKCMLSEVEYIGPEFDSIFEKSQMDDLLVLLLNYFHWFFEKRSVESNPNPSHIDISLERKQYLAGLVVKLESTKKQIGRAYGILILGVGMSDEHHMNCGRSRVSNTYRDRAMFETLYSFCAFVIWITFKRQEFDMIRKEVNSKDLQPDALPDVSSLAARLIDHMEYHENSSCPDGEKRKLTPAEYRRTLGKRPSKMDLANQRSTVMISIVPFPKEEADWLFNRKGTLSSETLETMKKKEVTLEELEQEYKKLDFVTINQNVGIIGMPLDQFNLLTLTLIDEDPDKNTNKNNDYNTAAKDEPHPSGRSVSSTTRLTAEVASESRQA